MVKCKPASTIGAATEFAAARPAVEISAPATERDAPSGAGEAARPDAASAAAVEDCCTGTAAGIAMVTERIGGKRTQAATASLTLGASQIATRTAKKVTVETAAARTARL
jgi:hypothetical protein